MDSVAKLNVDTGEIEHTTISETTSSAVSANPVLANVRSHHSQHHPLPPIIPATIKGKQAESPPAQQVPIDASQDASAAAGKRKMGVSTIPDVPYILPPTAPRRGSRLALFAQRFRERARTQIKSYYMYYSLNNLFDWIIYILCILTTVTHVIDVSSHTVLRARIHMYTASVTVLCLWFRFMVFFRTITISAKTLRSKLVEIKLGELVIMVRMMFDDIIRFLIVFLFLLAPYAFVFYAVFGGQQILHNDYERSPAICEHALLHCSIHELQTPYDGNPESFRAHNQYIFNGSLSGFEEERCTNATTACRIVEPNGFESFYALLFSIFRIALVDDIPIDSFTAIDRYFASFVCATYLLFTAILSINIFIGLISNALQTEAFSTVEARFLLERIEVILNYEWRLSQGKRTHLQGLIHRQCSPSIEQWKDVNFDTQGQSREEQQAKTLLNFRQTLEKQTTQFDTFRIQIQQKLNDIDTTLNKTQSRQPVTTPGIVIQRSGSSTPMPSRRPSVNIIAEQLTVPQQNTTTATTSQNLLLDEITRLRELIEERISGPVGRVAPGSIGSGPAETIARRSTIMSPIRPQTLVAQPFGPTDPHLQLYSQDLGERVTDLQLAVNRLHQDVNAIRQVVERMSPLSASLILGRTAGLK